VENDVLIIENQLNDNDSDIDIDDDDFITDIDFEPYINDVMDKYEVYDIGFQNLSS